MLFSSVVFATRRRLGNALMRITAYEFKILIWRINFIDLAHSFIYGLPLFLMPLKGFVICKSTWHIVHEARELAGRESGISTDGIIAFIVVNTYYAYFWLFYSKLIIAGVNLCLIALIKSI